MAKLIILSIFDMHEAKNKPSFYISFDNFIDTLF